MGLKLAVIASSALALAAATPADYVASRQQADGGFAERRVLVRTRGGEFEYDRSNEVH